jgi:TPR repeat protein
LDKYEIFDNDKSYLTELAKINGDHNFNINKHLSFKYFSLASISIETKDEANLKLGDFYYYG